MSPSDLPERIAAKIVVDRVTGCWLWQGATSRKRGGAGRYGKVGWERYANGRPRAAYAHRVTYHLLVDRAFPVYGGRDGEQIDHVICGVKHCCNPAHLEPVTCAENVRRYWAQVAA